MKYPLILFGVCGAILFGIASEGPRVDDPVPSTRSERQEVQERAAPPEAAATTLQLVGEDAAHRTPVEPPLDVEPLDPCADVRSELAVALAERDALVDQRNALRWKLTASMTLLEDEEHPDTPFGAFVHSFDGEQMTDATDRDQVKTWLREFPVILNPGEGQWIADRRRHKDWEAYGRNFERALIAYLGPARLAAELSPERVAELRLYYADEPGVFP
tara:strand:+ start:3301 stop:3951 length:651 start_codon:yes stop_codon:yes gene_type:complete